MDGKQGPVLPLAGLVTTVLTLLLLVGNAVLRDVRELSGGTVVVD